MSYNKDKPYNDLPPLPGDFDFTKRDFLKLAIKASEQVGKLNGLIELIPDFKILISPFLTKESVKSNEIENINTTTIKVLQKEALAKGKISGPEKEVLNYRESILNSLKLLKEQNGIGYNMLLLVQSQIEPNKKGVRKIPGTVISNSLEKVLYTPPDGEDNITKLLTNLEKFINNFEDDIDAFIKMPVIHYQFEAIHPFSDGNGRTGRILNILYLIFAKKLDYPILFMSEYINDTKNTYYNLLNKTTETGDYSEFIIYLLKGIIKQSEETSKKIKKIRKLVMETEKRIGELNIDYHRITNILFSYPYQTIGNFEKELSISRSTANRYIERLTNKSIINSIKIGKNKLIFIPSFINLISYGDIETQ